MWRAKDNLLRRVPWYVGDTPSLGVVPGRSGLAPQALLFAESADRCEEGFPRMVGINWKVAAITGAPVSVFLGVTEAGRRDGSRLDFWLVFILTAILCAVIVGVPQGYLAGVRAPRSGRWRPARLAGLLAAMLFVAPVTALVAFAASSSVLPILPPPGHWSPVPSPPVRPSALLEPPQCLELVVQTEDGRTYGYGARGWRAVEVGPDQYSDNCPARARVSSRSRTPVPPLREASRLVVRVSLRQCGWDQVHYVLGSDASLWRWAPRVCDPGAWEGRRVMADFGGSVGLSLIVSFVAWLFLIISERSRTKDGVMVGSKQEPKVPRQAAD